MDQIEEAAKIAHAHTFISSLEKGYETQVIFQGQNIYSDLFINCFSLFYPSGK
jgi:ABC-type bacteriocin/lantibiotic exporter with double-glycine peptidase domain